MSVGALRPPERFILLNSPHGASCCSTSVCPASADKNRRCCWTKMKTASVRWVAQAVAPARASAELRRDRCTSGIRMAPARSNRSWADTADTGETEQPARKADTEDTAGTVHTEAMTLPPKPPRSIASSASPHFDHRPRAKNACARSRDANRRDRRCHRHARSRCWTEPAQRTLRATPGAAREGRLIRQRRSGSPLKPSRDPVETPV